ncbi:MAG: ribonuclease P protein component [Robiginitomaculum sp.]
MTKPIKTLGRLRRRPEFLFVAQGQYAARGCLVVQRRKNPSRERGIKVGFTASKKVGNSVIRSRAKRRMREAARALLPSLGEGGYDYVFIARNGLPSAPWEHVLRDGEKALVKLAQSPHITA